MIIDKESLNIVRGYIGKNFMSNCITNINFANEAFYELDKHEAKIMRLPKTTENQNLKIAFRKVQNLVKYLLNLSGKRKNVRRAIKLTYKYTQLNSNGATTVYATYQDLVKKFCRVKVEVIKIAGIYNQIVDYKFKVNKVSSDLFDSWSYTERI